MKLFVVHNLMYISYQILSTSFTCKIALLKRFRLLGTSRCHPTLLAPADSPNIVTCQKVFLPDELLTGLSRDWFLLKVVVPQEEACSSIVDILSNFKTSDVVKGMPLVFTLIH